MQFSIYCECGQKFEVSEGSAGVDLTCECGRITTVPSSTELRTRAGLTPVEIGPEYEIPQMTISGELPPENCVQCGSTDVDEFEILALCEQAYTQKPDRFSWLAYFVPFGHVFVSDSEIFEIQGRDTAVHLPARFCDRCQREILRSPLVTLLRRTGIGIVLGGVGILFWNPLIAILIVVTGLIFVLVTGVISRGHQRNLKTALISVPVYERLFSKYSDAIVTIQHRSPAS